MGFVKHHDTVNTLWHCGPKIQGDIAATSRSGLHRWPQSAAAGGDRRPERRRDDDLLREHPSVKCETIY